MPLTGFTATPGCDVVKDGLVACYQFEGNLSDGSGNSNNGTAGSGATYAPGKTGQAISLSSVPDSYVFIRNPAQKFTTAYTITGWLFLRSDSGGVPISKASVNYNPSTNLWQGQGFGLVLNPVTGNDGWAASGHTLFNFANDPNIVTNGDRYGATFYLYPSYTLPLKVWKYVTATYQNSTFKLYINGVLVDQKQDPHISGLDTPYDILLGGNWHNWGTKWTGNVFDGLIDELRFYNRALSDSDIRQVCGDECSPPPSSAKCNDLKDGLVGCYTFDDGDARDYSGNWNNGQAEVDASYADGKSGKALNLNGGLESYVYIPNPAQKFTTGYTISGWILTRGDTGGVVFSKYNGGGGNSPVWGFALVFNPPDYVDYSGLHGHTLYNMAFVQPMVPSNYPSYTFPFNQFQYVTAVYDSYTGIFKLYIDGELKGQKNYPVSYLDNPYGILLGSWAINNWTDLGTNSTGKTFDGMIDELRLYNRALSEADVKQLYAGFTTPSKVTLAITKPTNGTIKSSDNAINCGTGGTQCQADYALNSTVTLTASADAGYKFDNSWTGDCNSAIVMLDKAKTCSANFVANSTTSSTTSSGNYTITIVKKGTGTGNVQVQAQVVGQKNTSSCNLDCQTMMTSYKNYPVGTTINLTATATVPSTLKSWTCDSPYQTSKNSSLIKVTMNVTKAWICTAEFQ